MRTKLGAYGSCHQESTRNYKQLIKVKAKLDLQAKDGNTALILASYNGHDAIVKQLLAEEVDLELKMQMEEPPLMKRFELKNYPV